jgi:hypothetical protein
VFLKLARQSSPILNRFAIYISNFSVEMRHIRGCDNYLADALSRNVKDEDRREKPQYLTEKQSHDIVDRLVLTPGTFFSDKVVQKLLLGIVPELPLGGAEGKKPRRTASLAKITAESTKPNQKTARVPPVPNSAYEKGTFPIRKGPRKKKGPRLKDVETPAVMMTFFAQLYPQFEENKRKSEANKMEIRDMVLNNAKRIAKTRDINIVEMATLSRDREEAGNSNGLVKAEGAIMAVTRSTAKAQDDPGQPETLRPRTNSPDYEDIPDHLEEQMGTQQDDADPEIESEHLQEDQSPDEGETEGDEELGEIFEDVSSIPLQEEDITRELQEEDEPAEAVVQSPEVPNPETTQEHAEGDLGEAEDEPPLPEPPPDVAYDLNPSEMGVVFKLIFKGRLTKKQFAKSQELDRECMLIRRKLRKKDPKILKKFRVRENILFHLDRTRKETFYLPKMLVGYVFHALHSASFGLHMSKNQCFLKLQQYYYRPNFETEIGDLVAQCFMCITETAKRLRNHLATSRPLPKGPREAWSLDLAHGFELSHGYKSVLICVDERTCYTKALPLRTKTGTELARVFESHIVGSFMAPSRIFTDMEPGFLSLEFQTMLNRHLIDHHTTARYSPSANGLAERYVGKVKDIIRKYCREMATRAWPEASSLFCQAINSTPLSFSTKDLILTPEKLMFGGETVKPYDLFGFGTLPNDPVKMYEVTSKNADHLGKILSERRMKKRRESLHSLNKKRRERVININDIVFCQTKPISDNSALQSKYEGPFVVKEKSNAVAIVEPLNGGTAFPVSLSHVYKSEKVPGTVTYQPYITNELKQLLAQ